jgi:tRNA pseudouridine38-40 synthase
MEMNLKAVVRYDGTDFAGWQVQPGLRTVQGDLEEALSRIAGRPIRIAGAGRTDAGVHALGQVFSWRMPCPVDCPRLRRSLSRMTGPDIRVEEVEEVAPEFHARKSARGKLYAYTLALAREPDPLSARYAWTVPSDLDLEALARLARGVVGEHDFAGFQGGGASVKTTVRTIHSLELKRGGVIGPVDGDALWRLEFEGSGFLYKMVRNITGTLVDVARGTLPESVLEERLHAPGPFHGHTAPACGLAMVRVEY